MLIIQVLRYSYSINFPRIKSWRILVHIVFEVALKIMLTTNSGKIIFLDCSLIDSGWVFFFFVLLTRPSKFFLNFYLKIFSCHVFKSYSFSSPTPPNFVGFFSFSLSFSKTNNRKTDSLKISRKHKILKQKHTKIMDMGPALDCWSTWW